MIIEYINIVLIGVIGPHERGPVFTEINTVFAEDACFQASILSYQIEYAERVFNLILYNLLNLSRTSNNGI